MKTEMNTRGKRRTVFSECQCDADKKTADIDANYITCRISLFLSTTISGTCMTDLLTTNRIPWSSTTYGEEGLDNVDPEYGEDHLLKARSPGVRPRKPWARLRFYYCDLFYHLTSGCTGCVWHYNRRRLRLRTSLACATRFHEAIRRELTGVTNQIAQIHSRSSFQPSTFNLSSWFPWYESQVFFWRLSLGTGLTRALGKLVPDGSSAINPCGRYSCHLDVKN